MPRGEMEHNSVPHKFTSAGTVGDWIHKQAVLLSRLRVEIHNHGVGNDGATGRLYYTFSKPGVEETINPFTPDFTPCDFIEAGQMYSCRLTRDLAININSDVVGLNAEIREFESHVHFSKED
jgi:hypothetical protein